HLPHPRLVFRRYVLRTRNFQTRSCRPRDPCIVRRLSALSPIAPAALAAQPETRSAIASDSSFPRAILCPPSTTLPSATAAVLSTPIPPPPSATTIVSIASGPSTTTRRPRPAAALRRTTPLDSPSLPPTSPAPCLREPPAFSMPAAPRAGCSPPSATRDSRPSPDSIPLRVARPRAAIAAL